MFQVDEKVIADNRTLITIQDAKANINPITKNGTIHYTMDRNDLWLTTPKIRQAYIKKGDVLSQYDKIMLARNGINIDGSYVFDEDQIFAKNVEIKKNLIVRGDFLVEGQSSVIDTPKLTIEDNVIELNRNETADGLTLNKAGMALNRGTKPFARYLYNEVTKAFVLDTNTTMDADVDDVSWVLQAHTEANGNNIAGEVRIKEKLSVPIGNITNNLSVANTTTSRILNILETSTFGGAAIFNNAVTIAGILTAKNNTIIEKLLNVKGAATFDSTVLIKNTLTVNETSTFLKKSTFQDSIDVNSVGDLSALFRKNVSVLGSQDITGTLSVTGIGNFLSSINVTDQVSAANAVLSNKLTTNLADINALTVKQSLGVTGPSTLNGNVTITGTNFNVTAASSLTGATTITGTLGVTENTTLNKNLTVNQALTVNGTSNLKGDVTTNGNINTKVVTADNYKLNDVNGNGIEFWKSPKYKIYMSSTTDALGGNVSGSGTSDYNMYFTMDGGTNRGFVFKTGTTPTAQLESTGIFRTIGHMFANGSQVLRQADEGHGNGIDADTLDGLHKTDYVLRDGSQEMTGDLKLGLNKIRFSNDDYFYYDDGIFNIGTESYAGKYMFTSDNALANSSVEAGAFKAGNIALSGKTDIISGVKVLNGAFGTMIKSVDEWLRINDDASHSNGVFFGSSTIRTDNGINIGDKGATLLVNASSFTYKGSNVITAAGGNMTGMLNMGAQKLAFNSGTQAGTGGVASSDYGYIYGEHNEDSEYSRLVVEISDNDSDAIVLRTASTSNTKKDSLIVNYNRATFADNPYYGSNRLLHVGDMGPGKGLDADTIDGKHYIDLQNEFVNVSGDTMSGQLTMNNTVSLLGQNKIIFNGLANSYIRAGGTNNNDIIIGSSAGISFYPGTDQTKAMSLDVNGILRVLGSPVVKQSDYGHGKGIDADTIDGMHYSTIDSTFFKVAGGTITGNVTMSKTNATMLLSDPNADLRFIANNADGVSYIQAGKSTATAGSISVTGMNANPLGNFYLKMDNPANATINGSKILTAADYGTGKGIDADKLDGKHAADFATSTHNHDTVYVKRTEVDLQNKYKIQYNSTNGSLDFMFVG